MPIRPKSGLSAAVLGLLLASAPGQARAGNTVHPRTPVLWPDAPCIQAVDRSVDPSFAFAYAIPEEDTALTVDEFADSRTHQFVAFCRQHVAGAPPPNYISIDDLDRAVQAGFEDAATLEDIEATLETSVVWADCWRRVTQDDARRPITFAAAAEPVVWDTSDAPAGTWMISGYTWEPPYNIWRRAPWVVRVGDGGDPPAQEQAAATLGETPQILWSDETLMLPTCVDAPAGSSLRFEWRDSDAAIDWTEIETVALGDGGLASFPLPFSPPPSSWGLTLQLRAQITHASRDPSLDYTAHALSAVIVIERPDPGETGGETDSGDTDSGTGGDESGSTATETSAGEDTGGANPGQSQTGSGRCSLRPDRGNLDALGLGLGLLLLGHRRTRRRRREGPAGAAG